MALGVRSTFRHWRGVSGLYHPVRFAPLVTPGRENRNPWVGENLLPRGVLGAGGVGSVVPTSPGSGHLLAGQSVLGRLAPQGQGWCWWPGRAARSLLQAWEPGEGVMEREGRLWPSSAPCPALRWISAGSSPALLAAPLGGLVRDRQKQNGSEPALCTELLLAQG